MSKEAVSQPPSAANDVDSENEDLPALVEHSTPHQKPTASPPTAVAAKSKPLEPQQQPKGGNNNKSDKQQQALTNDATTKPTANATPSLSALQQQSEEKKRREELEATIREQVNALFASKGDAGVQQMLQQQIQLTKKKESEIALAKKRVEQAAAELDAKQVALKKLAHKKVTLETDAQDLEEDLLRQEETVQKKLKELEINRESTRVKVQSDIDELYNKMKSMAEGDVALETENETLRTECAALKAEFDAAFASFEADFKQREADSTALVQQLQQILPATEILEATLLLRRREVTSLADATKSYQMQCEAFEERVVSFEEVAVKSEDIERTAGLQRSRLQKRLEELEADKKLAHEQRVVFEKDTLQWKGRMAAAKKKIVALERQKSTLEQKCRKLQEQKKA